MDLTSTSCTSLSLTYSGVSYTLTELHFHSPSEHSLGGGFFPAEAHMVHAASDGSGERLVLAVLLMESTSGLYHSNNTFLNSLWTVAGDTLLTPNNTVTVSNNTANPLNPYATFLPASRMQYVYTGSLTTPPCTEGVTFIVYQQPIGISSDDLSLIRALAAAEPASASVLDRGNSNRPVQPLGGRLVYMTPGENAGSAIFDNEDSDDDGVSDSALGVGLAALAVGVFALVLAIYNNLVSQTMMRFGGKDKVQLSSESLDRALLFH
ncbi:carbonic anhydrase family protein [archaeon]|nr:MAG: carbonic anhydrase family protein [archaeon]